ncbi:neuropeptide CCHamide-1 receptor-like [Asterias rubens]|uniref:neuropeptide CCHamide-1 receptor-like n=1 Tax=Asterias rubens TaxID=7604 RepID=UPI0014554976|nr:neuropeptide CCHamide-1 receptor-like [Asterias rubens]
MEASYESFSWDSSDVNDTLLPTSDRKTGPIGVAIFSIFGILGNLSIIYLVLRHKKLRNAPNILIINLTVGDLLYILSVAPLFIEKELNPKWESTEFTCKLKAYVEDAGQSMCVFSLAALSRERYLAIVRGIETRRRRGSCSANSLCAAAVVVTASLLLAIPAFIFSTYLQESHFCNQLPEDLGFKKAFVTVRFILGYVIPLNIVAGYYVRIAHSLYKSIEQFGNSESHVQQSRLRKRLALIVLLITVLFAVFWLPHFVYLHLKAYATKSMTYEAVYPSPMDYLRIVSFLMELTISCTNPWIIFIMSSKHRQHCCLFQIMCNKRRFQRGSGTMRLTTLTAVGTTRRTSGNVSQMSHV